MRIKKKLQTLGNSLPPLARVLRRGLTGKRQHFTNTKSERTRRLPIYTCFLRIAFYRIPIVSHLQTTAEKAIEEIIVLTGIVILIVIVILNGIRIIRTDTIVDILIVVVIVILIVQVIRIDRTRLAT